MNGVPVDDDLIYTQLGLLLFEKHGLGFTTEDVARMWDEYLYWVWIDMQWPLERFRKGVCAEKAADGNPWQQMICAFIRCDPYAYVAPGWPQKAAEFSYRDGLLSHRRNGLYGGMFFAAAIAAAFAVDDPVEAIRIGLTEIPRECRLAQEIRWALDVGRNFRNYRDARRAVDEKMKGMHPVHTINNACLVVLGLMIGGRDVSRVLSETVAMGLDNDCTAATAGSIVGAVVGKKGIPERWHRRFYDKMHSYIKGHPVFSISDMVSRYARQAQIVSQRCP
jgi:ADP-ribosylglycohydrolase